MKAFVAVGSNIDPRSNIISALIELKGCAAVAAVSTFYETEPILGPGAEGVEPAAQPRYWNGVWEIETPLPPAALKRDALRPIELRLGRTRLGGRFAPRRIDLDLVHVEGVASREEGLRLPHPEIRERPFVAIPLLELCPGLILPDTGEALAALPVVGEAKGMEPLEAFTREMREIAGAARRL